MPEPNCICYNCGKKHYRVPSRIGKYKHNYCSIKCRSEYNTGANNPFYGKKHSMEVIKKLKEKKGKKHHSYGKKLSKEHREILIKTHTGAKRTKQTREKISKAMKGKLTGEKNPMWKVVKTKETLKRMSEAQVGKKHTIQQVRKMVNSLNKTLSVLHPENKYKGHSMRSTWEVKFAKWLDERNLKWDYEPRYFVCGNLGWYFPDFYIHNWQQYVEVKGYESKRGMDKFNYWKNKEPNKFVLFNKPVMSELDII